MYLNSPEEMMNTPIYSQISINVIEPPKADKKKEDDDEKARALYEKTKKVPFGFGIR